jgi:hypothetical protein
MLKPLLLAAFLLLAQKEERPPETGIIAGAVTAPEEGPLTQPLQVVLLPPQYAEMWNGEVQRRLDSYWETFKPTFAQHKEIFVEATERAYVESTRFVVTRMRRELSDKAGSFIQQTSAGGRFEFKDVSPGEYMVLAFGTVLDQELIWQETIQVSGPIPQFLQLKKRIP